jgi:hypothetical protein
MLLIGLNFFSGLSFTTQPQQDFGRARLAPTAPAAPALTVHEPKETAEPIFWFRHRF